MLQTSKTDVMFIVGTTDTTIAKVDSNESKQI